MAIEKEVELRLKEQEKIAEAEIEMGTVYDDGNFDDEDFAFENTGNGVRRTTGGMFSSFRKPLAQKNKECVTPNELALSHNAVTLGGGEENSNPDRNDVKWRSDAHLATTEVIDDEENDYNDNDNKNLLAKKPMFTILYRFSKRQSWDDPYTALWFFKAPDLMPRIFQANVFFFAFYLSTFVLNLRFGNSIWKCLLPFLPLAALFLTALRMLPHFSMIRYIGTLTLDGAINELHEGRTRATSASVL